MPIPFFQLTMNLLTSISKVQKQPLMNIADTILPEILVLVHSPLLQGNFIHVYNYLFLVSVLKAINVKIIDPFWVHKKQYTLMYLIKKFCLKFV